jgi:hypothetical protein
MDLGDLSLDGLIALSIKGRLQGWREGKMKKIHKQDFEEICGDLDSIGTV